MTLRYALGRLMTAAVVFVGISILVFVLVRQVPGDPVQMTISPTDVIGGGEEFIEAERKRLGLDQPIYVQYLTWVSDVFRGNLGYSFSTRVPVTDVIGSRLGPTFELMGAALITALLVSVPLGILAALKRNKWPDYVASALSLSVLSTPSFFIGLLGIFVFALKLGWLPSAGMITPGDGSLADRFLHILMPAGVLGMVVAGSFIRYVRSSVLDQLGRDYLRAATARGASRPRVIVRHALRNSLIPLITIIAIQIPLMTAGAVVLEQVFAWPGMGQLVVSAIENRDYPVIVGFTLVVAALMLLSNLIADLLYGVADPRVRLK